MNQVSAPYEQIISGERRLIKERAAEIKRQIEFCKGERDEWWPSVADKNEVLANLTLTYRHLEDAAMRLGKVLQAWDGGVSVYDK